MPWNEETGQFDLKFNFRDDVIAGGGLEIIESDRVMQQLEDLATALDSLLVSSGRKAVGGDIDFGGQRIINAGDAAEGSSYATAKQAAGAAIHVGTFGGTANALIGTQLFTPLPIPVGYEVSGTAQFNNAGAMTYSHNASTPLPLNDRYGQPLPAGSVRAGDVIRLIYDEQTVGETVVKTWRLQTFSRHEFDGYLAARASNPSKHPYVAGDGTIAYKAPSQMRTLLELAAVATSGSYSDLTGGIPDLETDRLVSGTGRAAAPLSVSFAGLTTDERGHIYARLPDASPSTRGKLTPPDIDALALISPIMHDIGSDMTITPSTIDDVTGGTEYTLAPVPDDGLGPYELYLLSGALPPGLSFDPEAGSIAGIAQSPGGDFDFTLQLRDARGALKDFDLSITVVDPAIAFTNTDAPDATAYRPYSFSAAATGPSTPFTYALQSGALPAGLALNPTTGQITGSPGAPGTGTTFTVRATDRGGYHQDEEYTIGVVAPTLTLDPTSISDRVRTIATTINITVNGNGTTPYLFERTSGTIPPGLTLDPATGVLSGTPTTNGTFNLTLRATDANGFTATRTYAVVVYTPSITLQPGSISPRALNEATTVNLSVVGNGTEPYTYAVVAGALPVGLTLNSTTGAISGTPTISGTYNFTIAGTDANGFAALRAYAVIVALSNVSLTPTFLPGATGSAAYNQTVAGAGGTSPYSFAVTSGALPAGLSLNTASGAITGTPIAAGTFNFTVTATDFNGFHGDQPYSITVAAPTITITPGSLPSQIAGTPGYSQQLVAAGGLGPYTFARTSGALPPGLTLASDGALTGTPSTAGTYNFTITATDANGFTGSRAFTLSVAAGPPIGSVRSAVTSAVAAPGPVVPTTLPAGWSAVVQGNGSWASSGSPPRWISNLGADVAGQTWAIQSSISVAQSGSSRNYARIA